MVPTTAGTGAEVTRNAVLGSPEHGVKASLRSPLLVAKLALIDPDLTLEVPAAITASTGLDTLTQLIEPFVSCRANALTDLFCLDRHAARCGRFAKGISQRAGSRGARGHGLCQSPERPFPGECGAGHCARLCGAAQADCSMRRMALYAPPSCRTASAVNIRALRERAPDHEALGQISPRRSTSLTDDSQAEAEDAVGYVSNLCHSLGISSLRTYGLESCRNSRLGCQGRRRQQHESQSDPAIYE